ncbi:MAG: hypothetical protein QM820_59825 [Minicystis sp.]
MRTTLFLSTLFAVTLFGGAALAEKPHAVDRLRARGDVVDKSYRHEVRVSAQRDPQNASASRARFIPDRASSRVSCSEMGTDCPRSRAAERNASVAADANAAGADHARRVPAVLEKAMGSDRTSFNEAGESQGMSTRAAKRVWAAASADRAAANAMPQGEEGAQAPKQQQARAVAPPEQSRMSCDEAGCSPSSKATKKEWSYNAVRAGTWNGPEAKAQTGAEKKIAEMRSAKASDDKQKH